MLEEVKIAYVKYLPQMGPVINARSWCTCAKAPIVTTYTRLLLFYVGTCDHAAEAMHIVCVQAQILLDCRIFL